MSERQEQVVSGLVAVHGQQEVSSPNGCRRRVIPGPDYLGLKPGDHEQREA